ncbi:MAG: Uncharacterized protein XD68_0596 [Synergistales bacterium 54_24]|nr:MAG: Uncharacterized protein XD68_0596 [Synergistales bacterium 54_24]HAF49861.1 hypothetical protein [Synergistaceae bacterium]
MEAILRLIWEGFGAEDSLLGICRGHLKELVKRGKLTELDVEGVLSAIESDLAQRREMLRNGFKREVQRLLSLLPVATIDDIKMLERRLDALEEGIKKASSISL